tara:strand:- start:503 stop:1297 length:795 start_codon:yes stop_codon:yes gene_type:complete
MKIEYKVSKIPKDLAVSFVQKHHYSPVMPKLTKHYLGFFVGNELRGVLTLGWGTQPKQTINKMFTGLESKHYYEIGKMCMTDDMPANSESQMLSHTIRWLKTHYPELLFLYTMADGIMGKCGYVYQASNFLYGGKYLTQVYMMENGEKLHPRSTKELLKENCKYSNKEKLFWMTKDFMMHKNIKFIEGYMFRYIYPLNKVAKKYIKTSNMEWTRKYPKDVDLKWFDKTSLPKKEVDKPPFTFNNVIYNRKNVGNTTASLEEFMI